MDALTPQPPITATISAWRTENQPSGCDAQTRHASATTSSSSVDARPTRISWSATGADDAVGPQAAPPLAGLRGGEAPGRGPRGDVGEPGRVGPAQQAPAGIGLAAVGARAGVVQLEPAVEPRRRGHQANAA